jgi:plasmid maintenance system antidote protein VapI
MQIQHGKQRRLAGALGLSPQCLNDYLAGRRNASPRVAKCLGDLTSTDPFIWLLPDNVVARRAAVAAWPEPQGKK